jgi:raffinose/stachyose/melibiose transport system substrate-binding protein
LLRCFRFVVGLLGGAALVLGALTVPSAQARAGDTITLTMLANSNKQAAYDVLIPNFERVYPNIKIDITYGGNGPLQELEPVELAAGNGPDILYATPGCGTPVAVCVLAKAGYMAPMVNKPWAKRSLPWVMSYNKYGQGLVALTPSVGPWGVFTNDDLFAKLGLKVPQTFTQLLDLCQKAKADGTVALLFAAAPSNPAGVSSMTGDLAITTLYAKDKSWLGQLRAGKVTFDGTAGWHEALQEFAELGQAGCFEPGVTGTTTAAALTMFAQGQALMMASSAVVKGMIDAANPQFRYSHHPFPGGTAAGQTRTMLIVGDAIGVNAHASAQDQAAAQTFVDFIARPKQSALYAQTTGGITQYEFSHNQIPSDLSDYATAFAQHNYLVNPITNFWNAAVTVTLQQDAVGLLTGQQSVDDVLNAMDAAWKQGPQ